MEDSLNFSKMYDGLGYFSEVTPQAGDFGADVITVKDKTKTVIQAKCFGEGQSVGVEAINEVCGGAGYWNAQNKSSLRIDTLQNQQFYLLKGTM